VIHKLFIKNPKRTPCAWWPKVKDLEGRKTFRFTPGLNILWGRNGVGKSTILTVLARYFHCEQGGRSVVTGQSSRALHESILDDKLLNGAEVEHDGQCVFYINPGRAVGLMGGAFDDDFFMEGIGNTMAHISAGQMTLMRTNMVMKHLEKGAPKIEYRHSVSNADRKAIEAMLAPNGEKGPVTILCDEPDRSVDLDFARQLWDILPRAAAGRQIIVATHHVFALKVEGANYIDIGPKDYRPKCEALVKELVGA
jgi:energy-coupling factor transporter ATP-binding protein EcfA2